MYSPSLDVPVLLPLESLRAEPLLSRVVESALGPSFSCLLDP